MKIIEVAFLLCPDMKINVGYGITITTQTLRAQDKMMTN